MNFAEFGFYKHPASERKALIQGSLEHRLRDRVGLRPVPEGQVKDLIQDNIINLRSLLRGTPFFLLLTVEEFHLVFR